MIVRHHTGLVCVNPAYAFCDRRTPRPPRTTFVLTVAAALAAMTTFPSLTCAQYAFDTLADFDSSPGSNPVSGLVADAAGNLYGTTYFCGSAGRGVVFRVAACTKTLTALCCCGKKFGDYVIPAECQWRLVL